MPCRALYFTFVPIGNENNGGGLICRHHIRQLASDPTVSLTVCTTGPEAIGEQNVAYAASVGASHQFIPFRDGAVHPSLRWPFFHEAVAAVQSHVDGAFVAVIEAEQPDVIVVDFVPSALFIRSAYASGLPVVTITLNREANRYREMRSLRRVPPNASASPIANWRLALFEHWVYRRSRAVVALSPGDLPRWTRGISAVMSPLFPPRPKHWAPRGDGSVFFVGNVLHLPNQQAIEWIATRLSPALAAIGSSARLRIVGAAADSVPSHWRGVNVEYLGVADKATVTDEFCAADLFVAPIANPWGSKMKLLDCLAHGTPFAATTDALSGLPFLAGVPELRLDHPRQAAKVVAALLANPGRLIELSESSGRLLAAQLNAECGAWGRLLARVARFEPGDSRGM